jgi:hypothetical protein
MQVTSLRTTPLLRFFLSVCLALLVVFCTSAVKRWGDFVEYGLTTVAVAEHGTPYIRASDVERMIALTPQDEVEFRAVLGTIRDNIVKGEKVPIPGLILSERGHYMSIHFVGYSTLAAIPFVLLDAVGANPWKAYQVVNYAPILALAIACYLLLGSTLRAWVALILFVLCGAMPYLDWTSPEVFTMGSLMAGLILFTIGRPIAAAILAGLAATQNPPLVFFSAFAPFIRMGWLIVSENLPWQAALRRVVNWRNAIACALQVGLAVTPVLFSLWEFHEPSLIAKFSTDPALVTPHRLGSFFFDPNQGAIIAFPAITLLLAWLLWQRRAQHPQWHLAATFGLMLALAIPALSTGNWNSGASGPMRYVVWGASPLLYLALCWLALQRRWPVALIAAVLVLQYGAMWHAKRYNYTEFSPLGRWVLTTMPSWYNPDPEIFYERTNHLDGSFNPNGVIAYPNAEQPLKTLYNVRNPDASTTVCGPGRKIDERDVVAVGQGWRYINGTPVCVAVGG